VQRVILAGRQSDRLIPPPPEPTRYKQEVWKVQWEGEQSMDGFPHKLPPIGTTTKKGITFQASTVRIELE